MFFPSVENTHTHNLSILFSSLFWMQSFSFFSFWHICPEKFHFFREIVIGLSLEASFCCYSIPYIFSSNFTRLCFFLEYIEKLSPHSKNPIVTNNNRDFGTPTFVSFFRHIVSFLRHLHNTCWHKMVVIMASLSLSLCIAVVIVIIPLLSTIGFVGLLDCWILAIVIVSLCCCCHCPVVSFSLCVAVVVIVIPLFSTIVFVGLLDFGHCCHLFVLLLSLSSPCFQPLFLLDCWILAIVVISLCCCCHTIVVVVVCFGLLSLSLCVAVVIVIPLLSTIVLVGLLDNWIVGLLCWIIGLLVYWIVGLLDC